jgi:hypothetical protein
MNNKQNEVLIFFPHNVNIMESKFDETKSNLLQSKYPPDIIGFYETVRLLFV